MVIGFYAVLVECWMVEGGVKNDRCADCVRFLRFTLTNFLEKKIVYVCLPTFTEVLCCLIKLL